MPNISNMIYVSSGPIAMAMFQIDRLKATAKRVAENSLEYFLQVDFPVIPSYLVSRPPYGGETVDSRVRQERDVSSSEKYQSRPRPIIPVPT